MAEEKEETEPEDATGTLFTHVDCPCGTVLEFEGDINGETVECYDCHATLLVRSV